MKISLKEWLEVNGHGATQEVLEALSEDDSVCPALCDEGCVVEPAGYVPTARLLFLGLI